MGKKQIVAAVLGKNDVNLKYLQCLVDCTVEFDRNDLTFNVSAKNAPAMRVVKEQIADLLEHVKGRLTTADDTTCGSASDTESLGSVMQRIAQIGRRIRPPCSRPKMDQIGRGKRPLVIGGRRSRSTTLPVSLLGGSPLGWKLMMWTEAMLQEVVMVMTKQMGFAQWTGWCSGLGHAQAARR